MSEITSFDINKILGILPHRYPFLLVDRILEIKQNQYIKAMKNISINEPQFHGHFPDLPVMPGVLILESLAQTASLLILVYGEYSVHNSTYFFVGIDSARFKKPVLPGDQLILHASIDRFKTGIWKFKTFATVNEKIVTEANIMCSIRRKEIS